MSRTSNGVGMCSGHCVKIADTKDKAGPYTTFFIVRHAPTRDDHLVHGAEHDSEILRIPGPDLENFLKLKTHVSFEKLYSGNSLRTSETAALLGEDKCLQLNFFNEQKLGHIEGMKKEDALQNKELSPMLECLDYRIPPGLDGKLGETGREVISRVFGGIVKVASENVGKIIGICMSQCSINWIFKCLSNSAAKFIAIKNYEIILFRYYNMTDSFELLTPFGPICTEEAIKIDFLSHKSE
jgi:broad specificity phosphatase PhoE